jgi:hypothetical protein
MAAVMSFENESCVDWEILPDVYRLSRACFFFLAISYSSFSHLYECFHEIKFGAPCFSTLKMGDNVC